MFEPWLAIEGRCSGGSTGASAVVRHAGTLAALHQAKYRLNIHSTNPLRSMVKTISASAVESKPESTDGGQGKMLKR
jgi:hypothetical protein